MTAANTERASASTREYDVVIVGAGIAGALVAKHLGQKGVRVLILEAGRPISPNNNEPMGFFYTSTTKTPESPYTPRTMAPSQGAGVDVVSCIARGERSGGELVNPSFVNAPRPTVLSISMRAWAVTDKNDWASNAQKCDPRSDRNYFILGKDSLPFGSTYERIAGGTARHWLGISLRHLPNDFRMGEQYGMFAAKTDGKAAAWPNWPKNCRWPDLQSWYAAAETELGVSGDDEVQRSFERPFQVKTDRGVEGDSAHGYPMAAIPLSYGDKVLNTALKKQPIDFQFGPGQSSISLSVTPIPAARNSEPFGRRRACAGNSSCIPICPIQAKYDPTITMREALNTGNVDLECQAVATNLAARDPTLGPGNSIAGVDYIQYEDEQGGPTTHRTISAKVYVIAANAIETPRLLLMSNHKRGITRRTDCPIGNYLMDHPFYIAPAVASEAVFGYRGPLVTGGIENLRDGPFRGQHASFRCDVSNSGWSLTSNGTPRAIAEDLIRQTNSSERNTNKKPLAGIELLTTLNKELTRHASLGFLVEQTPDRDNRVTLSATAVDGLGLPRPEVHYDFSEYTKQGLLEAHKLSDRIFKAINWVRYTDHQDPSAGKSDDNCQVDVLDKETGQKVTLRYMGAGHIAGTCRMGDSQVDSVVNHQLRSWDHSNLYIVGSSVFPTIGTANPTLTIAALSLRLADHLTTLIGGRSGA